MKKKEKKKRRLTEIREFNEVMLQLGKDLEKTKAALKKTMRKLYKAHDTGGRLNLSPDVEEWDTTLNFLGSIDQKLEEVDAALYYALEHVKG